MYIDINFIHILIYNNHMENKYRHANTTVFLTNYHFIFCPRYRRIIFLTPNVVKLLRSM